MRPVVVTPVVDAPPAAQVGVDTQPGALAELSELDQEAVAARARQLVADVQERPGYYASVAGYATGGFVVFVVASAVVAALDRLPIIPSALQLVCWSGCPAHGRARGKGACASGGWGVAFVMGGRGDADGGGRGASGVKSTAAPFVRYVALNTALGPRAQCELVHHPLEWPS